MWLFFGVKLVGVWWGEVFVVCFRFCAGCLGAGAPVGCAEVGFAWGAGRGIFGSGLVVL